MNMFPVFPTVVFVGHPDDGNNEGFIMNYQDCKSINEELYGRYHEICYKQEMKPIIYEELKKYKLYDMSKTYWNNHPKPKPFKVEY